ncbi:hypothetical protein MKW98_022110 [Papaver atlanticum]|uniref:Uncharacterized protein n=1 Tax=Papaver atlanticum TaxID=357466 RepID=A0AAD4XZG2_9MAGN|nr:hypothetical protein MKW98_022110 [Papaver atlanticum]
MVSDSNGKGIEEEGEEIELESGSTSKGKSKSPLRISTSQKRLLAHEKSRKVFPSMGFQKLSSALSGLGSPSTKFQCFAEGRDDISRSVPSSPNQGIRERFTVPFARKINWHSLKKVFMEWIKDPLNMALFVWIVVVAVSGAILFMVMTGMLNHVITKKYQRDTWFEVNNQILNALFTLMCLYQHPKRMYHLILLLRWSPKDIATLRKAYCKDGARKPHEWGHMMVVVVLLHINCFAQYALCGLNLGYKRAERPPIGVAICISVAIGAPAVAGVYTILSPLGKEYDDSDTDQEAQSQIVVNVHNTPSPLRTSRYAKKYLFASKDDARVIESTPRWSGGLLDLWDDISLAYLSFFCSFCVFGWNMERLGFGNMCIGCDGHHSLYIWFALWRFLEDSNEKKEVRTVDFYEIVEDKYYGRPVVENDMPMLSPLRREDGSVQFRSFPSSPLHGIPSTSKDHIPSASSPQNPFPKGYHNPDSSSSVVKEESSSEAYSGTTMVAPPVHSSIKREDV